MVIKLTLALTFFNFVGSTAARVVLMLYALELGAPPSAVGILGGLFYLFPLLLSWPVGTLADRYGARGLLAFAGVCGVVSIVLPYFAGTLTAFYAAAALNGLALAFFHVTLQHLIGILSTPDERPRNFSNFSLTGAVTNFIGPLIAGFSIDHLGHAAACLYIAASPAIGLVVLLVWGRRFPPGSGKAPQGPGALGALSDREVWRMLLTSGLVQLGCDLFQFYMPVYGHAVGLSASAIGAVLASFAAASFVVRLFLARLVKRVPGHVLLAWSFGVGAVGFALASIATQAYALAAVAFLFGLGMGLGIPLTVILIYDRIPEGRSGQVLGLRLTGNNFVRVTGPVVFGAIGSLVGLAPVFWISAAAMGFGVWLSRRPGNNTP